MEPLIKLDSHRNQFSKASGTRREPDLLCFGDAVGELELAPPGCHHGVLASWITRFPCKLDRTNACGKERNVREKLDVLSIVALWCWNVLFRSLQQIQEVLPW